MNRQLCAAIFGLASCLATCMAAAHATIVIHNLDLAGQGFNDPSPFSPVGGNNATRLGQARFNALSAATQIWATQLDSSVAIEVDAQWSNTLPCTTTSATLAQSGTYAVYQDFPNAPLAHTSYPGALANAIAGEDLNPAQSDISLTINLRLGTAGCMSSSQWYLGLDGAAASTAIDLVTALAHEIGHGLGFQTYFDRSTGAKYAGLDDAYLVHLEHYGASPSSFAAMSDAQRVTAATSEPNLLWTGPLVSQAATATLSSGLNHGLVQLHAPSPLRIGSSVSHFSLALTPSQLMGPAYLIPQHHPGLAVDLLRDVGWTRARLRSVPSASPWQSLLLGALLALAAVGYALRALRPQFTPAQPRGAANEHDRNRWAACKGPPLVRRSRDGSVTWQAVPPRERTAGADCGVHVFSSHTARHALVKRDGLA